MNAILTEGCLLASGSMLGSVKRCPTYARYRYVDGRERTGIVAKGVDAGAAIHRALETRYRQAGGARVEPGSVVEAAMQAALAEAYAGVEPVEGDEHLTLERLSQVVSGYLHGVRFDLGVDGKNGRYQFPGYGEEPFDVLGVEVPFAVEIGRVGDVPIIYTGYIDLLTWWRERGEVIVLDTKTMRKWDSSKIVQWRMAAAPKGYAWCLPRYVREGINHLPQVVREALAPHEEQWMTLAEVGVGGKRVDGFALNAIVMRASTDLRRCKQPPVEYHRELFFYQDEQLSEWREDVLRWCEAWLGWCTREAWPMVDSACANHFGKVCPYECVCSLPPAQRGIMLGTDMFQDVQRGMTAAKAAEAEATT